MKRVMTFFGRLIGSAFLALSVSAQSPTVQRDGVAERLGQESATAQTKNRFLPLSFVPGQWTWASGSRMIAEQVRFGVYGTKGTSNPANGPGSREGSVSWTDASGNLWLFGGYGYGSSGFGELNDLWKRSLSSGEWTWVSGSEDVDQAGEHGTKGIAAPENVPGARESSVSWTDRSGDLWLFGGIIYPAHSFGYLNDLWKWNISSGQWTWVSGSNAPNQPGAYGTKGGASPGNVPGGRYGSISWTDTAGQLWLFGGYGYAASASGWLNDLWKRNVSTGEWTWVSGSNAANQLGTYGTQGVSAPANVPRARNGAVSWTDISGDLWLFGGTGGSGSNGEVQYPLYLSDLWKWNASSGEWTWVGGAKVPNQVGTYGTQNGATAWTAPGARAGSVSWTDASGDLWLFGGRNSFSYIDIFLDANLNDLWKFSVSSGQWTWVSGSYLVGQAGIYGTKGVAALGNVPGARWGSISWADSNGDLWIFGGVGFSEEGFTASEDRYQNDLWKFSIFSGKWTWIGGSAGGESGVHGTQGVADRGNLPGARSGAVSWTDGSGSLWLFGGSGFSAGGDGYLNDLWKRNISSGQWTWVSGSNAPNQGGTYGAQGLAAPGNVPGARSGAVSWIDGSGNLWLFGGYGVSKEGYVIGKGYLNDLWKWNVSDGQWTWVSGSWASGQPGSYGTKGVAASENLPGPRSRAVSWIDASGNLWLFGGFGLATNDLWKWDISTGLWTWVSGASREECSMSQGPCRGRYGTQGVGAPGNAPGARQGSVSWTDASGNLWLFGGYGLGETGTGNLNDLWIWNISTRLWTWVSGSKEADEGGTYGTQGVAAAGNVPGARDGCVSWTDSAGHLWLFGGEGVSASGSGNLNDQWNWNIATGQWTWVTGSNQPNQSGTYGTQGAAAAGNVPGARAGSVSWTDASGSLWLFGGGGNASTSDRGTLNDLWAYSYCTIPRPPTGVPGSRFRPGTVVLSASGASAGQDYKWYVASRGGLPLQTGGSSFTTPSILATTNYYVSLRDIATGCEGVRTTVTASVNYEIVTPADPLVRPVRR